MEYVQKKRVGSTLKMKREDGQYINVDSCQLIGEPFRWEFNAHEYLVQSLQEPKGVHIIEILTWYQSRSTPMGD